MNNNNLFNFKYNLTIISLKISIFALIIFAFLRIANITERNFTIITILTVLIVYIFFNIIILKKNKHLLFKYQKILLFIFSVTIITLSIITKNVIVLLWLDYIAIIGFVISTKKTASFYFIFSFLAVSILFCTYFNPVTLFDKLTILFSLIFFNVLGLLILLQLEDFEYENEAQKILLEKITMIDYLTDTYNRRAFYKLSELMINEAKRTKSNIGIIMIDIDYFKKINDTFGHHTGDIVLQNLANIIKNNIRKNDLFARVGGEEFIILINNTNNTSIQFFAQKLLNHIRYTDIRTNEKQIINITVSMGLYIFNPEKESLDEAINKADTALYKAKETRNRFIFYQESQEGSQSA